MQKFYVIVRNDMPTMNVGKMAAQVSHSTTKLAVEIDMFYATHGGQKENREWLNEDNIGTTIIMEGISEDIRDFFTEFKSKFPNMYTNKVVDTSYPFIAPMDIAELFDKNVHVDWDEINEDGFVKCYTEMWTCSGLFFDGNEEDYRKVKELMKKYNIHLM